MRLSVAVPGSKSMTQRALILSALADQPVRILGALNCDDSSHLTRILESLGTEVEWLGNEVRVTPKPLAPPKRTLHCGNGGTTMRFGSCLALLADFEIILDGDARMRERPFGPLGVALERMGVEVRYLENDGVPPLSLQRRGEAPTELSVDSSISSQFGSGLLMVAPRLAGGLRLRLDRTPVSSPYLRMTTRMMERASAEVRWEDERTVAVKPGRYFPPGGEPVVEVEPDWSSAAFLLAAAWVSGVALDIPGLVPGAGSLQGDAVFGALLEELGRPRNHEMDLSDCPDLIAPLAAACLFASHPTSIRGAAHARLKESDRVAVLCAELGRLGCKLVEHLDGMDVFPLATRKPGEHTLDPAGDHRMAMAFGVISLRVAGIRILDPECVTKSFPGFWTELERFRASPEAR